MEKKLRVLSVIGTRPEAVKMAPVVQLLARTAGIEALVCVTAQHREMLDQVLKLFEIKPDVDLDLMQPDQSLAQITAAIFTHLDPVLKDLKPDDPSRPPTLLGRLKGRSPGDHSYAVSKPGNKLSQLRVGSNGSADPVTTKWCTYGETTKGSMPIVCRS